jgi:Mn-dependent DtxR family transcriptional regulator
MQPVKLDEIEIEALQQFAIGKALGRKSSREPHASRRMVELGLVDHDVDRQLQVTEAGREWLAAWNSGYNVR